MKTKICIIGCGNFARSAHGPSYNLIRQADSEVEYAACADMAAEKAASYAAAFGLPRHYTDWREMAAAEKPEIMGKAIAFVGLGEGIALFGFLIALFLYTKI